MTQEWIPVSITEQAAAALHLCVPRSEVALVTGPAIEEVYAAVQAQGLIPAGPWFAHHRCITPGLFDFDVCVPVNEPFQASGRVFPTTRRAARVLRTQHHGDYSGLPAAWAAFRQQAERSGLPLAEDLWEIYLINPGTTPNSSAWITELHIPLLEN